MAIADDLYRVTQDIYAWRRPAQVSYLVMPDYSNRRVMVRVASPFGFCDVEFALQDSAEKIHEDLDGAANFVLRRNPVDEALDAEYERFIEAIQSLNVCTPRK